MYNVAESFYSGLEQQLKTKHQIFNLLVVNKQFLLAVEHLLSFTELAALTG